MPEIKKDKIELPVNLAMTVAKILQDKYGINHPKGQWGFDASFTQDELSKITELTFDDNNGGMDCCKGVELLPNLKKLCIRGKTDTNFTSPEDIVSIKGNDVRSIEKCKSLESLTIENQNALELLDISKLSHLRRLDILGNPNLRRLDGLDKLSQLEFLTCFGNERLCNIENLDKIIENSSSLRSTNLDVLLFLSAIGYKCGNGQINGRALDKMNKRAQNGGCSWTQAVMGSKRVKDVWGHDVTLGVIQPCTLTHAQMIGMHNTACKILEDNIRRTDIYFTVPAIENWIAKNVVYNCNHKNQGEGLVKGDNSAHNCLVSKSCICEGYARGMQYLLALRGIQSHTVHCIGGRSDKNGINEENIKLNRDSFIPPDMGRLHCILCVTGSDMDSYEYYCDPCWDAGKYQFTGEKKDTSLPYCMLTKSEMSKIHTLTHHERGDLIVKEISRNDIAKVIESNELFLKTKSAEVKTQRERLNGQQKSAPVRGMILTGRN